MLSSAHALTAAMDISDIHSSGDDRDYKFFAAAFLAYHIFNKPSVYEYAIQDRYAVTFELR